MELTRQVLDDAKFETRGRWYNADQVDAFLDELAAAIEGSRQEADRLRQEVQALKGKLQQAGKPAPQHGPSPAEERARLLEDVRVLKQFREQFRQAVEQDAPRLLQQARHLDSDKLL